MRFYLHQEIKIIVQILSNPANFPDFNNKAPEPPPRSVPDPDYLEPTPVKYTLASPEQNQEYAVVDNASEESLYNSATLPSSEELKRTTGLSNPQYNSAPEKGPQTLMQQQAALNAAQIANGNYDLFGTELLKARLIYKVQSKEPTQLPSEMTGSLLRANTNKTFKTPSSSVPDSEVYNPKGPAPQNSSGAKEEQNSGAEVMGDHTSNGSWK